MHTGSPALTRRVADVSMAVCSDACGRMQCNLRLGPPECHCHDRRSTHGLTLTSPRTLSCLTSSLSIPDTWFHSLGDRSGCDDFKYRREFQILVRRKRWLFSPPCTTPTRCALVVSKPVFSLPDMVMSHYPEASGYKIVADEGIPVDTTIVTVHSDWLSLKNSRRTPS